VPPAALDGPDHDLGYLVLPGKADKSPCQRAPWSAASCRSPSIGRPSAGGLVPPTMMWTTSSSLLTPNTVRAAPQQHVGGRAAVTATMIRSTVSAQDLRLVLPEVRLDLSNPAKDATGIR
jgi:hypothetical protein